MHKILDKSFGVTIFLTIGIRTWLFACLIHHWSLIFYPFEIAKFLLLSLFWLRSITLISFWLMLLIIFLLEKHYINFRPASTKNCIIYKVVCNMFKRKTYFTDDVNYDHAICMHMVFYSHTRGICFMNINYGVLELIELYMFALLYIPLALGIFHCASAC